MILGIYQQRSPIFFSREGRLNWSHPLNILEPTTWKVTSVNRCLVFHLFGFKISFYGASFQQNTPIAFRCNFLLFDFLSSFFWFSQSQLVFLHDFPTLVTDRGSLVYSFLRFVSTFIWIIRTILFAHSFEYYFQCINVGLRRSVSTLKYWQCGSLDTQQDWHYPSFRLDIIELWWENQL